MISVCENQNVAKGLQWCPRSWCLLLGPRLSSPQQNPKKKKKKVWERRQLCIPMMSVATLRHDICGASESHKGPHDLGLLLPPWFCAVLLCCCFNSAIDVVCHPGKGSKVAFWSTGLMTHMQIPEKKGWVRMADRWGNSTWVIFYKCS